MPIPLFNSVASWFLKKRINQIELFKKYPNEVQQEVLRKLLVYNIKTEFINLAGKVNRSIPNWVVNQLKIHLKHKRKINSLKKKKY